MSDHNEDIDSLILSAATADWLKIAVMISKVFEDPALQGIDNLGQAIAERIYILVDNGRLEAQGNMRRWRDSEVRLIEKDKDGAA